MEEMGLDNDCTNKEPAVVIAYKSIKLERNTMDNTKLQANLLNRIEEAQLFTNRFASFNKADYEVLMFTVFLDCLEGDTRDYDISIALGIPESKVRTLRVKSQLQYPREIRWEEKLVTAIEHGSYDPITKMITISIEDPSVRNRIRYEVESKYGTVNLSLNNKQLILPVESFLILAACAEEDTGATIKKLNKELKKSKIGEIEKGNLKSRFLKDVDDVGSLVGNLGSIFTTGTAIISVVAKLIQGW